MNYHFRTSKIRTKIISLHLIHLITNRRHVINFFFNLCGGTSGTAATTGLVYQPRMIGDGDCGEIGRMKIGRGNRSTRRKRASIPLCPPQTPHAVRTRTQVAAVERQRLTA
jgi:hypothetical protein